MTTKQIGQAQSIAGVSDQAHAAFLRILQEVPVGASVSLNDIRDRMDLAQIPRRARGALMGAAAVARLIDPVVYLDGDRLCEVRERSTGSASRGSAVRLYRRTGKKAA